MTEEQTKKYNELRKEVFDASMANTISKDSEKSKEKKAALQKLSNFLLAIKGIEKKGDEEDDKHKGK